MFQGLKIMEAGERYLVHMGKYPVISVSLKSMKQYSYELAFDMLKKAVREEYKKTLGNGGSCRYTGRLMTDWAP